MVWQQHQGVGASVLVRFLRVLSDRSRSSDREFEDPPGVVDDRFGDDDGEDAVGVDDSC